MKTIKKFLNLTGKEMIICTLVVIFTTTLGVTAQFIGLFSFTLMAHAVYTLIKSPEAIKKHKAVAITLIVGCTLICISGGALIYVAAGKGTLCGSCAGLFGAFVMKEAKAA